MCKAIPIEEVDELLILVYVLTVRWKGGNIICPGNFRVVKSPNMHAYPLLVDTDATDLLNSSKPCSSDLVYIMELYGGGQTLEVVACPLR